MDTQKLHVLTVMMPPNNKKRTSNFVGIINYLNKLSPSSTEVCEPLRKLTSTKTE